MPSSSKIIYQDCPGIRKAIMKYLEALPKNTVTNVLHSSDRIRGKELRIDRQGVIAPTAERNYQMLNIQIQLNNGVKTGALAHISRPTGTSQPTLATLLVKDGLVISRDQLIEYWREVMTPWGENFSNKGWVTEDGLQLADAELLADLRKTNSIVVGSDEEDYQKEKKIKPKKQSARQMANDKNYKPLK